MAAVKPRLMVFLLFLSALGLVLTVAPAKVYAATLPSGFAETQYGTGLSNPTAMELAPDGTIFVTEQSGALRVIKKCTDAHLYADQYLDAERNANSHRDAAADGYAHAEIQYSG